MKNIIFEYIRSKLFKRINYIFIAFFILTFISYEKEYTVSSSISPTPQGKTNSVNSLTAALGLGSSNAYFDFTDVITSNNVLQKFLTSTWVNSEDNLQEMNVFTHYEIDEDEELDASVRNRLAVNKIRNELLVSTSRITGLVKIEIESTDSNYGKALLSFIQNASVDYINKIEFNMSSQKVNFLSKRISQIGDELEEAEYDLQLFLEKNKNYSSPELQIQYLNKQRKIEIKSALLSTVSAQMEVAKIENLNNLPAVVILDKPYILKVSKLSTMISNLILVYILSNLFIVFYLFYIRFTSIDN
jgi:uncharacterized protein involved in exopolysaccharide biosynthesis